MSMTHILPCWNLMFCSITPPWLHSYFQISQIFMHYLLVLWLSATMGDAVALYTPCSPPHMRTTYSPPYPWCKRLQTASLHSRNELLLSVGGTPKWHPHSQEGSTTLDQWQIWVVHLSKIGEKIWWPMTLHPTPLNPWHPTTHSNLLPLQYHAFHVVIVGILNISLYVASLVPSSLPSSPRLSQIHP